MTSGSGDGFDLDMAAASLQANSVDVPMMLRLLVNEVGDVLGKRLVVERAGGLFRKSDAVKSVEVTVGDDTLRAEVDGGTVRCSVGHSSGGIRIRSAQVDMDEWLRRLLQALQAEAAHSERARQALENIVIGGQR
ncbi:MAG TPA: hypothetical protein VLZ77_16500 [Acidimicrobiales bacterium]|nr:hypothetical protein [Acidimicrobiales bacterium]